MSVLAPNETILGYKLRERIGHGGYGEVWSAEAPGGMLKAVKFIYGFHDEARAVREQKSLDRVKGLRHPFLLSLERIEVSEGRLIVVSELADMSLKDRFDQYQAKGMTGIPRSELLGYLSDAADALDFMHESHSLQHLDVKPDNLLIVGGHVKVADFGLVKELEDVQQSFMGGLTPTYASPELFDGSPSSASDQYSLAVLYQEMLTDTRPFPGCTAAQLAAQHMQNEPNLDSLSRGDQVVIGRALEKMPSNRYANCNELIVELKNRTISRSASAKSTTRKSARTRRQPTNDDSPCLTDTLRTSLCSQLTDIKSNRLGALQCDSKSACFQPTLFVSIGETATSIMRAVRKRITNRVGGLEDAPSIRFLCMDTDTKNIRNACNESPNGGLYFDDILPLPLRTPMEYRGEAELHTSWLSRRWIYNVPRTLQTEGIRPLGRLAFADHHQEIFDRLHDLIESATLAESVAKTAEATGLSPSGTLKPRVFIVGSISGGVGSGMIIDVAYAIRTALIEQGYSHADLTGILTYASGRSASQKNLGMANAFSCLSELYHFDTHAYPGDPVCKLPAFDSEQKAFDSTYLVDMTGYLLPEEYTDTVESIGEYLFLNAISACSEFFDAARKLDTPSKSMKFRAFGVNTFANPTMRETQFLRQQLLKQVVRSWTDGDPATVVAKVEGQLAEKLDEHGLTLANLAEAVNSKIQQGVGDSPDTVVARLVSDSIHAGAVTSADGLIAHVDKYLSGRKRDDGSYNGLGAIRYSLEQLRTRLVTESGDDLCNVILGQLDVPGSRLVGATAAKTKCCELLSSIYGRLGSTLKSVRRNLELIADNLIIANGDDSSGPELDIESHANECAQLFLQRLVIESAMRIVSMVRDRIDVACTSRLTLVLENLSAMPGLGADLVPTELDKRTADQSSYVNNLMVKQLSVRIVELANQADYRIQGRSLSQLARREVGDLTGELATQFDAAVSAVVSDAVKETDLSDVMKSAGFDSGQIAEWVKRHLKLARPELMESCGGDYRLLLAIPTHSSSGVIAKCLEQQFGEEPTVVPATHGGVAICYEAEQIPLRTVLLDMIRKRPDCIEYVSRLYTRIDVDWTPVTSIIGS